MILFARDRADRTADCHGFVTTNSGNVRAFCANLAPVAPLISVKRVSVGSARR
jgi:hypothetical protein